MDTLWWNGGAGDRSGKGGGAADPTWLIIRRRSLELLPHGDGKSWSESKDLLKQQKKNI